MVVGEAVEVGRLCEDEISFQVFDLCRGVEDERVEARVNAGTLHEFEGRRILRTRHSAPQGKQSSLRIAFDAHINPDKSQSFPQRGHDFEIEVVWACLDDRCEVPNSAPLQRIGERIDALQGVGVSGQEEIIIMEDEDFYFPLVIQVRYLIGHVLHGPQPEVFAGLRLLMPGGDAAEGAMRIATTTRNQRSDAVTEALGRRAAAVGRRKFVQIRESRQARQSDVTLSVAVCQAGDRRQIVVFARGLRPT